MSRKPTVLVIDDEAPIHRFLSAAFEAAGYHCLPVTTGADGLNLIASRSPDVVVLDLGLPDLDGKVVLERARKFYQGPILILSARAHEIEKIECFELGADDYVEKPFAVGELMARVKAALRKTLFREGSNPLERFGDVEIDLLAHEVFKRGQRVRLTPREHRVFEQLAKAGGKTLTHRQILAAVWGPSHVDDVQYLRIAIQHLRQKLEDDPSNPQIIVTELNMGYRLAKPAPSARPTSP